MDIKSIIVKKMNSKELLQKEIEFFVDGYTAGKILDYHASALLVAIKLVGMTEKETFYLTNAMLNSGTTLNLSDVGLVVDKHSTGGISDTTTLALAPICAVCGVKMLKMSGRGLGHTGGTIDKLESFDGFKADIPFEKAIELLRKNNACIISANQNLAPADKKIYALRDAIGATDSLPLIASSIMSKKLATGSNAIVLDVKYGNGAFMKTKSDALALARLMVKIGKKAGKKMDYVVDDMNEPLGYCIGNKLEALEAIDVLKGKQSKLFNTTLALATKCISLGLNISANQALAMAQEAIFSGKALQKFKTMIADQGGSLKLFSAPAPKPTLVICSPKSGTLKKIDCQTLGYLVGQMGASRTSLTQQIDYNVGIKTFHKLNATIQKDEPLFEIYAQNKTQAQTFAPQIQKCFVIK